MLSRSSLNHADVLTSESYVITFVTKPCGCVNKWVLLSCSSLNHADVLTSESYVIMFVILTVVKFWLMLKKTKVTIEWLLVVCLCVARLISSWPHLRCDVGLEEWRVILRKLLCATLLCTIIMVRAVVMGRLTISGFDLAYFPSDSVSLIFMMLYTQ